jgi:outer membrane protein OmpA-like peptidoglycan-associated protein
LARRRRNAIYGVLTFALGALQADVQWLKDHPSVRFYIEGYASTRGEDIIYNLLLSVKRGEGVRQALMGKGIPENRIMLTTGWGSSTRFARRRTTHVGARAVA